MLLSSIIIKHSPVSWGSGRRSILIARFIIQCCPSSIVAVTPRIKPSVEEQIWRPRPDTMTQGSIAARVPPFSSVMIFGRVLLCVPSSTWPPAATISLDTTKALKGDIRFSSPEIRWLSKQCSVAPVYTNNDLMLLLSDAKCRFDQEKGCKHKPSIQRLCVGVNNRRQTGWGRGTGRNGTRALPNSGLGALCPQQSASLWGLLLCIENHFLPAVTPPPTPTFVIFAPLNVVAPVAT